MQAQDTRVVDAALGSIQGRVADMKHSLGSLLVKLEHEQHSNWPSIHDNFIALSGHASNLMKQLRNEKTPPLQNLVVLPLEIRNEPDRYLEQKTEGRVRVFHHEVVPDYLRTKLDLSLEQYNQAITEKATSSAESSEEIQKKVEEHNAQCAEVLNLVTTCRNEWREAAASTSVTNWQDEVETKKLTSAMAPITVTALKEKEKSGKSMRAQSSAKVDIKAATSAASHPYQRGAVADH